MGIILLVDDDRMVQSVTRELLEISGYEVRSAENGAEALAVLENRLQRIDLVMLDLSLPDMDGRQLLDRITRLRPETRIIICTGSIYEITPDLNDHPAVRTVLHKPFNLRTLQEAVRSSLAA